METFRALRGKVWHSVHEIETRLDPTHVVTLCGKRYASGETDDHGLTCPGCLALDTPLRLNSTIAFTLWAMPRTPRADARHGDVGELRRTDLATLGPDGYWQLTARGRVWAADYTEGPVPMPDATGVVHARPALRAWSRCQPHGPSLFGNTPVTTSLYAKLRARERVLPSIVTCWACVLVPP